MLPIIKLTTLYIFAKPVSTEDPDRWPGLGGVIFFTAFQKEGFSSHFSDLDWPILVWDRGEWRTHTGTRDIDA